MASGACERSTPSHAACWGSTPDPLEHDSHAAMRVCFVNIAQNSRTRCVRSRGLGCCPTSKPLNLAIQRHCLLRLQLRLVTCVDLIEFVVLIRRLLRQQYRLREVYPTVSDKPPLRSYHLPLRLPYQSPSPLYRWHCTVFSSTTDTCNDGYRTSASPLISQ